MAESTLSLKYTTLRSEIGYFLGYGRTSSNWDTAMLADIQAVLDSGLRQFYHPPAVPPSNIAHRWTFLEPIGALTTTAPYSTGTIVVVDGVVTLTGGTFPSWAAAGELWTSLGTFTVDSRDSGTQLTLNDLTVDLSAGATYTLYQSAYTLSDDFGSMIGQMTYRDRSFTYPPIRMTSEGEIRRLRQMVETPGTSSGIRPLYAAVRPLASTGATGQRFEILFYPYPGAAYSIEYRYHAYQNTLASDEFPLGGQAHAETILESCLAIAEERINDEAAIHSGKFMMRLRTSIDFDRTQTTAHSLGMMTDGSDGPEGDFRMRSNAGNIVTYNGVYPT